MENCKKLIKVTYVIILFAIFSLSIKWISYAGNVKMENSIVKGIFEDEAKTRLSDIALRDSDLEALKEGLFTEILIADDWIAVGNKNNVIGVFDNSGELKYCIRFTTTGMYKLLYDINADGLVIGISRNNTYYSFDINGNLYQITDYTDRYVDSFSDSLEQDTSGNYYFLKTKRLAKTLFLKQSTLVIKRGEEESLFLESDSQYKGRALSLY